MSIINIFAGSHCHEKEVCSNLVSKLGYEYITDDDILASAEKEFNISASNLARSMYLSPSFFNNFTH